MKIKGQGLGKLCQKLYFMLIPTSGSRSKYIMKRSHLFKHVGENLFFQPRKFPDNPDLISIGDNVKVSSEVMFINHDIAYRMLNDIKGADFKFNTFHGVIKIGNNVMIGARSIILYNVNIGDNVIIAAGSIVNKDIPPNSVVAGCPAKVVGSFDDFVAKRINTPFIEDSKLWIKFYSEKNLSE